MKMRKKKHLKPTSICVDNSWITITPAMIARMEKYLASIDDSHWHKLFIETEGGALAGKTK